MSVPSFITTTEERRLAEQERQRIARDLHLKGARQTPAERDFARAIWAEKVIRNNLKALGKNKRKNKDAIIQTKLQLSEVLATQGKFSEAGKLIKGLDKDAYKHYRSLQDALVRDDDATCPCKGHPINVQTRTARGPVVETVVIPSENVVAEVYSTRHRKMMPLVRCSCGTMNITGNTPAVPNLVEAEKQLRGEPVGQK